MGRLAVATRVRGQGVGEHLLLDALRRALRASRDVASVAVVVDATDDHAVAFYRRYGFAGFLDTAYKLFLPTAVIERLFPEPPDR